VTGGMARMRKLYKILVENPAREYTLQRLRQRYEDNIKMDIMEIRWECVDWIQLVQDRYRWKKLANEVTKPWIQ
jgi:hypothetical protein